MNLKVHTYISLLYFVLAAFLGVVLRSAQLVQIPLTYKFTVHTHSHIALLGWVYVALTTLFYKLFIKGEEHSTTFRRIFWFTQVTLVGMLLSFPFQGYALFSIIFSTLFLIASYWFMFFFLRKVSEDVKKTNAFKCARMALWYMVLSSIGPWALGAIMNTLGATSILYKMSIYFYLHFQYNGWMVLALLAIFLYLLEEHNLVVSPKVFNHFFRWTNLGIVLSFFLSTLWVKPHTFFYIIGGVGAIFQLMGIGALLILLLRHRVGLVKIFNTVQLKLLVLLAFLFGIKMVLQLVTAIPFFANLAATIIDFTIGYLHLTFLGVVTIGLFLFLNYFELLQLSKKALVLYIVGFLFTEVLIFNKGIMVLNRWPIFNGYFEVLAFSSFLIPVALLMVLVNNFKQKRNY